MNAPLPLTSISLRGVTVGGIGVGTGVYGGTRCRVLLPSAPARDEDENGGDDCHHEDEPRDGYTDGEGLGREAEGVGVFDLFPDGF